MRINLYGRHPSIADARPTDCDLAININDTPHPCDWMCFGDLAILAFLDTGLWPRRHAVGLIGPASFEHVHPCPSMGLYRTWQSLAAPVKTRKSGIMAFVAAIRFGATSIHTWGIRMHGERDVDGTPSMHAGHTAEQRWNREQRQWDGVLATIPHIPVVMH